MLGKTLGRVAGEVVASPFTVVNELGKAVEEAADTIERRIDEATNEPKKKGGK